MSIFEKAPQEVMDMLVRSGDLDTRVAFAAQYELAKALEEPLRQGVLVGDVLGSIFEVMPMPPGSTVEFPLDLLAPGQEDQHVAYTKPHNGRIPERQVEGDYVMVPTYGVTNSIDWLLRYAREARWDIVTRALQVLRAGFTKKLNDDGWQTLITAAVDRNILVHDADATAGQFTKRLVSLMKVIMRRNGGGNTGSLRRGGLSDLYVSPEAVEDIRNWGVDQIDEITRREIFISSDDRITRIFGVNIHDMDEFGEDQEYQNFYTDVLGASLEASDVELVVGLDQEKNDSFLMPVKEDLRVFPDPQLHRSQREGYYAWMEVGFACLDNRRCILGSF